MNRRIWHILVHSFLGCFVASCSSGGSSSDDGGAGGGGGSGDDTQAPTVSILLPSANGSHTTNSNSIAVTGTASDNVRVASIQWESETGGSGVASGTESWSIDAVALIEGDNVITVTAVDDAGLTSSASITVTMETSVVTVSIQSPTSANSFTTIDATVRLAGSASSSEAEVTSLSWSNSQGMSGDAAGVTAWETEDIALAIGSNLLIVTAQDQAGNSGSDQLLVERRDGNASFVEGKDTTPPSASQSEPAFGDSYIDPAYGLTVRKVSDAAGTRFNRNIYSRIQPENADGSMFMTYHGNAEYRIYDRQSLALVRALPEVDPDSEVQWHPTDPDKIRFTSGRDSFFGSLQLLEMDITDPNASSKVIIDLAGRLPWPNVDPAGDQGTGFITDAAEGSPSADGNRYAWLVIDRNETLVGMVTVDISTDTILGTLGVADWAEYGEPDHVSMSPSGKYVVSSHDFGTLAFDVDFTNRRELHNTSEHSDIGINAAGNDAYLFINFDNGALTAIDLETDSRTELFNVFDENTDTSIHVSGKAFDRPGWAVVSTYFCRAQDGASGWACNKVFIVEMAANPRILNLAHTYNCGQDFWTEPHAVPSRDLRRVYYNSDWGSCGIDAEVMQIDVPPF